MDLSMKHIRRILVYQMKKVIQDVMRSVCFVALIAVFI